MVKSTRLAVGKLTHLEAEKIPDRSGDVLGQMVPLHERKNAGAERWTLYPLILSSEVIIEYRFSLF